jgi:hypothetical protein
MPGPKAQADYFKQLRRLARLARVSRDHRRRVTALQEKLRVSDTELVRLVEDPLAYKAFNMDPALRARYERSEAQKQDAEKRRRARIEKEREERAAAKLRELEATVKAMVDMGLDLSQFMTAPSSMDTAQKAP